MRAFHQGGVWHWGWILALAGVILPRQVFLHLLYAVGILGLSGIGLKYVSTLRPPVVGSWRGLAAVAFGQVAALGTALYITTEGLATWLGLTSPGKLIGAILLAALAGQTLQIDLGFPWWSDPLAQMGAADPTRAPLILP